MNFFFFLGGGGGGGGGRIIAGSGSIMCRGTPLSHDNPALYPAHQQSRCGLLHLADEPGKRLHLETGSHNNQEVTLCEVPLIEGLEPLWKLLPKENHTRLHHSPTGDTCRNII